MTIRVSPAVLKLLGCPKSHRPLSWTPVVGFSQNMVLGSATRLPATDGYLTDGDSAYPVVEGFPTLLWPDAFAAAPAAIDIRDPRYCEAYREMAHYNPIARDMARTVEASEAYKTLARIKEKCAPTSFPEPPELWMDRGSFEMASRTNGYRYISPLTGKVALNIGGIGRDAVRFILAGAEHSILVTPMIGEAVFAWALAGSLGVQDRLSCVLGVGEELPLLDHSVDVISSHGCMHHMQLQIALGEYDRVLTPGGKFIATDPWRAPFYGFGTTVLGKQEQQLLKRDQSIFCRPITAERLASLPVHFPDHVIENHGPLLRYPLIALSKFGIRFSQKQLCELAALDDKLGNAIGLKPHWGSSLLFGGTKRR
jgi:SAM-dependent methyltransferase